MDVKTLAPDLSVAGQLSAQDIGLAAAQGFRALIINRPDGETSDQPASQDILAAAESHGLEAAYLPVIAGKVTDADVDAFKKALQDLPAPVLAFCRTGARSTTLWALAQAGRLSAEAILATASAAGYDLSGMRERLRLARPGPGAPGPSRTHDVVIIGGGAGGLAAAASLLRRRPELDVAIVEPRWEHYYQPGWTLVGGGVFRREQTMRPMAGLIPKGALWVRAACAGFEPDRQCVVLEDGARLGYRALIVAPGLKLDWDGVEGLRDTLGRNGVTSNYAFDMATYTFELVRALKPGARALFTQPPMPIKCAGAPQKAMYLSCDAWRRRGVLKDISVHFHNAGGVLFGVKDYVPALMAYVERYGAHLHFNERLIAVDGAAKTATFEVTTQGVASTRTDPFDMLHVCPPQTGLDFVKQSPLADAAGWIDVDGQTLQHTRWGNIFALGDAGSTPNAKTAAAVRKQAPVAAHNVLRMLDGQAPNAVYNGYGSCPLTVERGKIVLAEFAYGGVLDPSFPAWLIDGRKPTRLAWFLKEKMLPWIYFDWMLKGDETLARPKILPHAPAGHEAQAALETKSAPAKTA